MNLTMENTPRMKEPKAAVPMWLLKKSFALIVVLESSISGAWKYQKATAPMIIIY